MQERSNVLKMRGGGGGSEFKQKTIAKTLTLGMGVEACKHLLPTATLISL